MTTENQVEETTIKNFEEGTILHNVRADKYTQEVKETFIIECRNTGARFRIKKDVMIELAKQDLEKDEFSYLLNNGWEASGKMSAGAGNAVKIKKIEEGYDCVFYTGEQGKAFDSKKIQSKSFIKLNKEHLGAIFTFLRLDNEVATDKATALKIQRTNLDLG